jgi:hypothetical protein
MHGVVQARPRLDDDGEVGRHVLAHKVIVGELGRVPAGHAHQPLAGSRSGAAPPGAAARARRRARARRGSAGPRAARGAGLWRGGAAARCFRRGAGAARVPACRAGHGRGDGAGLLCGAFMLLGLGRRDEACEGVCGAVQQPAAQDRASERPTLGNTWWSSRKLTPPTGQQRRPAGSLAQSRRRRPGGQRSGAAGGLGRPADHKPARHLTRRPGRKHASERSSADLYGLWRSALGEQLRQQRQAVQHKGLISTSACSASHASTAAGARAPHSVIA